MWNVAAHTGLCERMKWSMRDVKPGKVVPTGVGDDSFKCRTTW